MRGREGMMDMRSEYMSIKGVSVYESKYGYV